VKGIVMTGPTLFANLARISKVLALLLFFVPWVAVSCSPDALQRVQSMEQQRTGVAPAPQLSLPTSPGIGPTFAFARAWGFNMAVGSMQLTMPPRFGAPGTAAPAPQASPQPDPEIGVIAGAALIVLALIATFLLKGAPGFAVGAGASLLSVVALCYSMFIHYPAAAIAAVAAAFSQMGPSSGPPPDSDQLSQILTVKPEGLFYLVLALLIAAVVFNILAMKKATPPPAAVF
jgi:hypothetical protein